MSEKYNSQVKSRPSGCSAEPRPDWQSVATFVCYLGGEGSDKGDLRSCVTKDIPRKTENKTKVLEIHAIT